MKGEDLLSQLPDLNTPESHAITMVLQEYAAFRCHTEIVPNLILTLRNQLLVFSRTTCVFDHLVTIKPVLYSVVGIYTDHTLVPFTNFLPCSRIFIRTDKIIQRSECAVSLSSHFCIRMFVIIEQLVFETNC